MSWRPEGWEKIAKWVGKNNPDRGYYESGADAILNALEPLIRQIAPSSKLIDILYPMEKK